MPFEVSTIETVTARLRSTRRFVKIEVLKRFASIADPSQITIVIMVDEGPVKVNWDTGAVRAPGGILGGRGPRLMFMPILDYEDGYGFSYGVQFAIPNPAGSRSRLAFPMTWGGEKMAGVELEKNLERGPFTRVKGAGLAVAPGESVFRGERQSRPRLGRRGASIREVAQRNPHDRLAACVVCRPNRGIRHTGCRCGARHTPRSLPFTQCDVREGGLGASCV